MTEAILNSLKALSPDNLSEEIRFQVKEAARSLMNRFQTPFERAWQLGYEDPVIQSGVQVGIDTGLWEAWTAAGGGVKSLDELCKLAKVDIEPNLLRRFLRHLAAFNVVEEKGIDQWAPTTFSTALGTPSSSIGLLFQGATDHSLRQNAHMPIFLKKTGYKEPLDNTKDSYSDWNNGVGFFAQCQEEPRHQTSFIGLMSALAKAKKNWTDVYDTAKLLDGADLETSPLFVDIGAAHGIDTKRVLEKHPDLPTGSLVVQDLPDVMQLATNLPPQIKKMPYDFFTPQPVKGARAYFMHAVPHDWPDFDAQRIFERVAEAMKPGYSKLLLYEVVLPKTGANGFATTLDTQLMNFCAAFECSESMWSNILTKAGLKIVKIHAHPGAIESVIEIELI